MCHNHLVCPVGIHQAYMMEEVIDSPGHRPLLGRGPTGSYDTGLMVIGIVIRGRGDIGIIAAVATTVTPVIAPSAWPSLGCRLIGVISVLVWWQERVIS